MSEVCPYCKKDIKAGEARYAGSNPAHWECREQHLDELDAGLRKFGQSKTADELQAARKDPLHGLFRKRR